MSDGSIATTLQALGHGEDTVSSLARSEKKRLAKIVTPGIIHSVLQHLVSRTLQVFIGSEDLTKVQIAALSVDWVAAQFSSMLPESFAGQNLQRASSLIGTKHHDQERTLLHMLMYLGSNHMILDDINGTDYNLDTAEALVLLLRLVDLRSPSMLHNLIDFSYESATLTAVVEELFEAAIMIGALDLVADILKAKPSLIALEIQTDAQSIGKLPPLLWAVLAGSIDLVYLLVKFRADVNELSRWRSESKGWTPLALAACHDSNELSYKIASVLLQNGADPNSGVGYAPLPICLSHGNIPLALELIALGAAEHPFDLIPTEVFHRFGLGGFDHGGVCATLMQRIPLMSSISLLGFAVCACDRGSRIRRAKYTDGVVDNANELVVLKLLEAFPITTKPPDTSDLMILAASRGHLKVMSYVRTKLGQAIDSVNGAVSPLYAAILWNQVDAARQLLEWGASALMDERLQRHWIDHHLGLPTPLHIAIQFGSSDMIELLIHHHSNVNQPSKFFVEIYSKDWQPYKWKPVIIFESYSWFSGAFKIRTSSSSMVYPLFFAALQREWDKAGILLSSGAEPSGDVLVEAAKQGQLEVVARLLEQGVGPDEPNPCGLRAFEVAATQGHVQVVSHLFQAGASVSDSSFTALFCLPDALRIRAMIQDYSQRPVHQDKITNRSYLENAILRGHKEVVDLALEFDQDYYDSGALCAATLQDILHHSAEAQLLLHELVKRRESPSCVKSQIQLSLEATAISMAAFHDRLDIIDILLRTSIPKFCQASGVRLPDPGNPRHILWCQTHERIVWDAWHNSDQPVASPLEYAAMGQSKRACKRLLQEGYRPDAWSVHEAMSHLQGDVIETFIELCKNINITHPLHRYNTPLQAAVMDAAIMNRNRGLVKKLLAKGADVNMYEPGRGVWGLPALTIAAQAGDLDLVSLLLDNGADVDKGHSSGAEFTALQIAVAKGYISIVKCLIDHNADVYARRQPVLLAIPGCGTPLEEAARWGRLDILCLLLDSGVSTIGYSRVQYGLSIIWAQQSGHQAVVQALCSHRPWSTDDQEIYQELTDFPPSKTIFFHPKEYPEGCFLQEITDTLRQRGLPPPLGGNRLAWRWWKDEPLVPKISTYDESSDAESEDVSDESTSSQEDESESTNQELPADSGMTDTAFQDNSIVTTFYEDEDLDAMFFRVEDSTNVDHTSIYWPHRSITERSEGDENMTLGYHTLRNSFEQEQASMEQSLVFQNVDEFMNTLDHSLWPHNDVWDWRGDNGMNPSIESWNWDLEIAALGGQQDADESMEIGAEISEHDEG